MKEKSFKRWLSLALAVLMIITAMPFAGGTFEARAEDGSFTEDYYTYTVENGEATIIDCDESISGDVVIPSELGGYPVTSISWNAFRDCINLTSITIPNSVTSIDDWAFDGCTSLTSITVSSGNKVYHSENNCIINTEEKELVLGCKNSVIPSDGSVTSIGKTAFSGCTGLTSISIPDSVTSIGNCAFYDCNGLTTIAIPGSVTSIGAQAFEGTSTNLEKIEVSTDNPIYHSDGNCLIKTESEELILGCKNSVIPQDESVTSIAAYAFKDCVGLTSIEIPGNVTSIGFRTFFDCVGLTSVVFFDGVTNIDETAFHGCTGLTSIKLPNSLTNIGNNAFLGCSKLEQIEISSSNPIYHSDDNCLIKTENKELILGCKNSVIPSDGSVTSIGNYAFYNCAGLTSITIPNSVTSIGFAAFDDCTNLSELNILGSLTYLDNAFGKTAWFDAQPFGDIYIKNFYYTYKGLMDENTNISIKDGTEGIAGHAFYNRYNITNITIPNSIAYIGNSAFSECCGLTSVTIPDSVKNIGEGAFYRCSGLTNVRIGKGVTYLGHAVFDECTNLTTVEIDDGLTSISDTTFHSCPNLTNITIPSSMTSIGFCAFYNCTSLKSITIPNSVTSIGMGAFDGCTGLKSVTIGNSVTSIGEYAFEDCTSLTSITIPKGIMNIGDEAFGYYLDEENDTIAKIPDFTIYGYAGTAAEYYADENGFTFIPLDDEHTHTFSAWTVTTEATCTAEGVETRTCSGCGATETRKTEKKEHSLTHVEEDSTCKIQGVSYDICDMCGNTFNYSVLPLAPHTFGEWKVTKEATSFEYGERMRSCSVCGFEEKERIEKLPVSEIKDEKTGISVICPDGSYDGKVEIEVTETFDGTSYHVLNTEKGNFKKSLFDITTTIDGEKVQPNGTVFVKIPLPDGYNAEKTVVYYVTNDGKLEKIESEVKDGYIIFETTHFSFYAVVDESSTVNPSQNCSCACHKKGIAKFFFKIKLIFQKIFKKNKLCKCGVNHY